MRFFLRGAASFFAVRVWRCGRIALSSQKSFVDHMEKFAVWLRRYVSPVFLALFVAAFIFWYIAKLNYTYSTHLGVRVEVDGVPFEVDCVVQGVGTNLFGYKVYMNKTLRIPLSALKYKPSREEGHEGKIILDSKSLMNAIAVQLSDIKVLSVDGVSEIDKPQKR